MTNRYVCSALEEMRTVLGHLQALADDEFGQGRALVHLHLLVEEIQTHVNRMESALYDRRDARDYTSELRQLKREVRSLREERDLLKEAVEDLERDYAELEGDEE